MARIQLDERLSLSRRAVVRSAPQSLSCLVLRYSLACPHNFFTHIHQPHQSQSLFPFSRWIINRRSQESFREPCRGPPEPTFDLSSRSVEPAILSCSKAHSRSTSPMLPSFRLSRSANASNSLRRSCRIRMLICAFQMPIERVLFKLARHAFTTKGMPADNGFCDLFAH